MQFILDLIIFLLSLSVLVVIHELGHFLTAKAFGVYCREFSIGMGPLIFKHKRKNGETQFSLRAIPIGGFVSMVGEDAGTVEAAGGQKEIDETKEEELSEEDKLILSLPPERRLDGIKRYKRAIIMAAGVTMNLILGFFLFIGEGATSLTFDNSFRCLKVTDENGLLAQNGYIDRSDFISGERMIFYTDGNGVQQVYETKDEDIQNTEELSEFFTIKSEYFPCSQNDKVTYYFQCENPTTKETYEIRFETKATLKEGSENEYSFPNSLGVALPGRNRDFGEVLGFAWNSCVESSQVIFKGLGMIFSQGLDAFGGPIAMFQISSQATSLGVNYFFRLWGLISINLAIMNFLPIPGLDGWHFLVLIFEGITKKEMPAKAKSIASMIGLILLFGLMIVVTIKDFIRLF